MGAEGIFVRPASVPKGVWGKHGTFRIEDIPDNRREEVIQFMMDNYFKDEPVSSIIIQTAPYSEEDIRAFLNNGLNDNVALFAVDEVNNDKIAGVTMVRLASRCAPSKHTVVDGQLTSLRELFLLMENCLTDMDLFTYDVGSTKVVVDHVLEPMGLSVNPEYRGKGIAGALIRARHKLAATLGLGGTKGLYTSVYSQIALLHQPNMKTFNEILYSEYLVDGKAKYAQLNPPHPSVKVIGGLITKDMA